ncbi:MAG: hypothetical protein Q4E13_10615 [Clostridia bacterium]|nr:hypothetical protein [Clostridia bacterium]
MKQTFCLFLALFLCCSLPVHALAEIVPMSNEDITSQCSLTVSGKSLSATARIQTRDIAETLKITNLSIQEYRDGKWVSVKQTSGTKSNSFSFSKSLSYTGRSGYKYRAVAKFSITVNGVKKFLSRTSTSIQL